MPANTNATPKTVLHAIHNLPKRVKSSGQLRSRSVRRGKENATSSSRTLAVSRTHAANLIIASESFVATRWAPRDGKIVIKVSVPCMDDIWKFKVPEGVTLERLTRRVEAKVGFPVALSYAVGSAGDSERAVRTEDAFHFWVDTRIQKGINTPLIARVRV